MSHPFRASRISLLACLAGGLLAAGAFAEKADPAYAGRNFDARRTTESGRAVVAPSAAQQSAVAALQASVPELTFEFDSATGATRKLFNQVGFLTGPNVSADNKQVALDFLASHLDLLGISAADFAGYEITDDVASRASVVRHLYLRQTLGGVPVYNGQLQIHVANDGRILGINNLFLPDLKSAVKSLEPAIGVAQAIAAAADHLGVRAGGLTLVSDEGAGGARRVIYRSPLSTEPIEARLMIVPVALGEAHLAWNFQLWRPAGEGGDIYNFNVDARTGKVWTRSSWVDDDQYKVYELPLESPNHTTPVPPADARTTQINPASPASPFGWHDTNGVAGAESTLTIGNNVQAYTDTDANNTPDAGSSPDCTASLNCTFPLDLTLAPSAYRPAAVTNLFYWNNIIHDVAYPYGFDEVSGNFQVNNYGNGGLGNDSVQAEAQDGFSTNNANFGTPPDGQRPRMQMFIWTAPTPDRDGDVDNGIIVHEYGHGISNRLVGGPLNVDCLDNNQQPGEGLSDWWALFMTQKNDTSSAARIRGIGTYALNQATTGVGIRADYYDGDPAVNAEPQENTWTYSTISAGPIPHGVGSRWAQAYWQVTWALIDEHGYEDNLYDYTGTSADEGNIRAMYYIIEGLKNTACSPTFTDVRDGILAAAAASYGGEDVCTIWKAFAEFGLGSNANPVGPNSTSPTNGFNIPASCNFLGAAPETQSICAGTNAVYSLVSGQAFTGPVTLTLTGQPAGVTVGYTANPMPPSSSNTLTISNTAAATAGAYNMNLNGNDGAQTFNLPLVLNVFSAAPSNPVLSSPANNSTSVAVSPTLTWSAATQASTYTLEIATDAGFSTIVYTQTVTGTSHTVAASLNGSTNYWWRVRATNTCGAGGNSAIFRFTTLAQFCSSTTLTIPDNVPAGVTQSLTISGGGTITDLDVSLQVSHTFVGDLIFRLTHVDTGTVVTFFDRPGSPATTNGCSSNDINAILSDEGSPAVETMCNATAPAISGTPSPNNPLSAFDGQSANGTWTLTASDNAGIDTGSVTRWCVLPAASSGPIFQDGFELGNTSAWSSVLP